MTERFQHMPILELAGEKDQIVLPIVESTYSGIPSLAFICPRCGNYWGKQTTYTISSVYDGLKPQNFSAKEAICEDCGNGSIFQKNLFLYAKSYDIINRFYNERLADRELELLRKELKDA